MGRGCVAGDGGTRPARLPVRHARFLLVDRVRLAGVDDASVDFCFSYNVFRHFPNAGIFWRNIGEGARVLKPGGHLQIHFRGSHGARQRLKLAVPRALRRPANIGYRLVSLKWLRGLPIKPDDDPADPSTWELGVAASPAKLTARLRAHGFEDVRILTDPDYADGRRFWALARKAGRETPTEAS
ncbi:MAG: class I SAM-dependent methyltransferase [SAR202 cluster bacterium]|nr:class I SAM-dependent methyltransferase [SAR202 cluster bacterium]